MLSICKISLRKINLIRADEDGRMIFLHNEFLLFICVIGIEKSVIC